MYNFFSFLVGSARKIGKKSCLKSDFRHREPIQILKSSDTQTVTHNHIWKLPLPGSTSGGCRDQKFQKTDVKIPKLPEQFSEKYPHSS